MQPPIVKLDNPIQHYAWGSHEAIARLQGRPWPSAEPEAELWIGDHPTAPSRVVEDGSTRPLPDWIARDRTGVLGPGRDHLPFLAKILAAARSLSVQVHPDADQARRGHARECAAGVPEERRCYRDANPKHELLVALSRFEALCGFRDDAAVREATRALPALRVCLEAADAAGPLAVQLLVGLQRARGEARERVLGDLERLAAAPRAEAASVQRLLAEHPGDVLAAAPLFLNAVSLEPGQALAVRPGTVHSYLHGIGVEVMTRSDNVVRAGLTPKHVDPDELLAVIRPEASPAEIVAPAPEPGRPGSLRYDAGVDAFGVCVSQLAAGEERPARPGGSAALVLCVEGAVGLSEPGRAGASALALAAGEAALVPARVEAFQLRGTAPASRVFQVSSR